VVQSNLEASNSDNDDEEESSVPSLARGRKLSEAACLRITRIEKVLATRNDLSIAERRSLRARKNTANFRERRKIAAELKHFHTVELDAILNCVSFCLLFKFLRNATSAFLLWRRRHLINHGI